ncbi:MAG: MGMT family protein [Candidatus Anstonellaceae archaeon]
MKKLNLKKIFFLCRKIPKGRVSTYSELAKAVGYSNAIRAVANALRKSPCAPKVPCHRIVRANAFVGGYKLGEKLKIKLLKREGIKIKNKKILDFNKVVYFFSNKKLPKLLN